MRLRRRLAASPITMRIGGTRGSVAAASSSGFGSTVASCPGARSVSQATPWRCKETGNGYLEDIMFLKEMQVGDVVEQRE